MTDLIGSTVAAAEPGPIDEGMPVRGHPDPSNAELRIALVGTYPPTPCGIATYTANVRTALELSGVRPGVIRLLDPGEDPSQAGHVVASWCRRRRSDLADALAAANDHDAVVVQHEYGIYPGRDGRDVVDFVSACARPVVTVLHTVIPRPSTGQRAIIAELARRSSQLIVHTDAARRRLLETHRLDPMSTVVIPHGAEPNLVGPPLMHAVEPLMLTWGLLGPGKGVEHGIEAVARLRRNGLDVRYVIAGGTHPNVRAEQGETYREGLQLLARRLGVGDLVDFDDQYRDWQSLHALVRSATLVLVPYDTREQVTSGVLVEALAAGKPIVSTPFPHALELVPTGAVHVVDDGCPSQLATAIGRIVVDHDLREAMQAAARAEGAQYDWRSIGARYREVLVRSVIRFTRTGAVRGWS